MFGGAFDPPHHAHVALAQAAMAQLQLDQLRVVPTGQAWHKSRTLSPARHRCAMARLAFAGLPGVEIDARETRRPGPSYTVETLRELAAEQPGAELVLLLGQDQAAAFTTWHAWQEIGSIAIISIAARPDSARAETTLDALLQAGARCQPLELPAWPVSSSEIRQRLAAGERVNHLVPDPVARYIDHHHLYRPV